jgi:hypothetical protein
MPCSQHSASIDSAPDIIPASPRLTLIPEPTPDPWDSGAPRAAFPCVICADIAYEEWPDADSFTDVLEKHLDEARLTPHGFVCSRACMSQLMFQCADEKTQGKMLRFERALAEIAEVAPDLSEVFEEWEMVRDADQLHQFVGNAREELGYRKRTGPNWITTNEAPEVALEGAIRSAVCTLDWKVGDSLRVEIMSELRKIGNKDFVYPKASEYQVCSSARALGSLGNVMLRLREAVAR